ncbi:histone deacetylase 4 isoform X1, partial [Tachysurus ichikawai]
DVHHCSTTQEMFYTDPNILHISLHRYGNTMHSAVSGRPDEVGLDDGVGFNVNVQWSCDLDSPIGDAEYLAAFRTVIRPIAQQFCPEFILISTEFNSVTGHPKSQIGPRILVCPVVLTEWPSICTPLKETTEVWLQLPKLPRPVNKGQLQRRFLRNILLRVWRGQTELRADVQRSLTITLRTHRGHK